jgi:uncharacterized protein (TIGR02118 family)
VIKVSIMYPNSEGATFDAEYYCNSHIPLVEKNLVGLRGVQVDVGIPGPGGAPSIYAGIAHLLFDSLDDFGASFAGPGGAEVGGDTVNYTDISPVVQFSEVRQ